MIVFLAVGLGTALRFALGFAFTGAFDLSFFEGRTSAVAVAILASFLLSI